MFSPDSYTIAILLFFRLLGLVYFFAFGAFIFQIKGLIGENGILPLKKHLGFIQEFYPNKYLRLVPTLFWFNCGDRALMCGVWLGIVLSILLMLGIYPAPILLLLYVLYLSIVNAGQDFLSFGWEGFLLEITVNAFFLSLTANPNLYVWISLNLVLFRFHFQGGIVKLLSKDINWRNLTGVFFHYQSQPLPNAIAWYAYKLPLWFHKFSTFLMLVVEIIVPFAMLGPDWMRLLVFLAFVGLQWGIWFTGNFSYLNHLTVVLSVILVANIYLPWFEAPAVEPSSWILYAFCTLAGYCLIILQAIQLWEHFAPNPLFERWLKVLYPFHITNRYGIFAVMTTKRYEIIFEGSDDNQDWKEYGFYFKPGDVGQRPRRISPYQPRLDWQAWFLPFGSPDDNPWLAQFTYHLLKGTPEVLKLIRTNPFSSSPPRYVRTVMYDYIFTTYEERKKTGAWWKRKLMGIFTFPAHLRERV